MALWTTVMDEFKEGTKNMTGLEQLSETLDALKVCCGARHVREHQNENEQKTLFLLDLLRYSKTSYLINKMKNIRK